MVGRDSLSPGLVGLSISYALTITKSLSWLIRATTDVETNVVAVERLKDFADNPKEADWFVPNEEVDESWPSSGAIEFQDLSLRYR